MCSIRGFLKRTPACPRRVKIATGKRFSKAGSPPGKSIRGGKSSEFQAALNYIRPDIVCGTESWLKGVQPGKAETADSIKSSEETLTVRILTGKHSPYATMHKTGKSNKPF
ncbi:hypothetical protein MAR_010792 [Mya arenaria]|uniref:Uncharacterized protein n=1 Tax=Mya arenaria TaxID=6604 RepID=A0ABY7FW51_MYAAR|nr:hypothetical protein MAR_010792 [Mya arenaria]